MKSLIIIVSGLILGTGSFRVIETIAAGQWSEAVWVGIVTLAVYLVGVRLVQEFERES